ncbi:MAG: tRNA 2-thiouridine(34) synthase MnmA [Anaerolineae bacterium]|nr:MAG: tRNA 2-thiouridine(34) synthase MnmA [Anaerolineae bacterium]
MSGGVDSSVAAALLKEQGYNVIGMMLRLWSEPGRESENRCCTLDSMSLARRIAARLDIPFYAVDARQVFRQTVVEAFIDGYTQGITPNPCLVCNRKIRWGFLLEQALALGADYLATGHYARLRTAQSEATGETAPVQLLKGRDEGKDQSYVLHVLNQRQLRRALFPVGEYTKEEVRQMARDFNLPVASRADSQDLCFLGEGTYAEFLERNAPAVKRPGPILNTRGEVIGEHRGLAFYTIGQRRGLGIAAAEPLYVKEKDLARNALVVAPRAELGSQTLLAAEVNWIRGEAPPAPFRAEVKIRYKARPAWATVTPLPENRVRVQFDQPLRDITPGQAAVFYQGEVCLGGGLIQQP